MTDKKVKKSKTWIWIVLAVILVLAVAAALLWHFIVMENVAEMVIVEAGTVPAAEDFKLRDLDFPISYITDLSRLKLHMPGDYQVVLEYNGREYESVIRVQDTTPPAVRVQDLTTFCAIRPEAPAFVISCDDVTPCTVKYKTEPDMTMEGDQTLTISVTDAGGNETLCDVTLTTILDDTPPKILGAKDRIHYVGTDFDLMDGVVIKDDLDPDPVITTENDVNPDVPGEYTVCYRAVDKSGNEASKTVKVTVRKDINPPVIYGLYDLSVCEGGTIAYKKDIVVTDDYDEEPVLEVDSSNVDLSTPGEYTVVYTATDAAGNVTRKESKVTVCDRSSSWVDDATIEAAVEKVASQILTDDMTPEEQVRAIYNWVHRKYYTDYSDKSDWRQAGYQMIRTNVGDCFSFFSASKLLFEYCGIPNIDVHRLRLPCHTDSHFWSMVSIDGGENYYYFDATPNFAEVCLVTDEFLDYYGSWNNNFYSRDRSILPATPENPPE